VLTTRGIAIRVVSIASNLILLTLVTPAELGFVAIVRAVLTITSRFVNEGVSAGLLRGQRNPDERDYAALSGLQVVLVLVLLAAALVWPVPFRGFNALKAEWNPWVLALLCSLILIPLGSGARVRLKRELEYRKLAFVDVSTVMLQNAGLLVFAAIDRLFVGAFIVYVGSYAFFNLVQFAMSRGPLPIFQPRAMLATARGAVGYSAADWLLVTKDHLLPIFLGSVFGLYLVGIWDFGMRLTRVLNVAIEGIWQANVPVAPQLVQAPAKLRKLASDALSDAAELMVPAATILVVSLPVLIRVWPNWSDAVFLGQVFALSFAFWGIAFASLEPVAAAQRGAAAVLGGHFVSLLGATIGLALYGWTGLDNLAIVAPPMYLLPIPVWYFLVKPSVRPGWSSVLTKQLVIFLAAMGVYALGTVRDWPDLVTALLAVFAILPLVRPITLARRLFVDVFPASERSGPPADIEASNAQHA
jgi:hypothetical protein